MRNLVAFTLAFCCAELLGQKIDGVYYGDIVSPKNTMVIKSNGEYVNGIIYLDEKDTVHFSGVYSSAVFKSTVRVKGNPRIELKGYPQENAMWIRVLPDSNRRFLNKVATRTNYKVKRLYAEDIDPRLLGRWEGIKSVTTRGVEDAKVAVTYYDDHRMYMQLLAIPQGVNRSDRFSDAQLLSQKLEHSWTANGYQKTEKMVFPNVNPALIARVGSPPPIVSVYVISHDTLTSYGGKGGYTTFKKK